MFIVNVEGAVVHDDRWLIIKRSAKEDHAGGTLSLVGGKADADGPTADILEKTVKREIFEEVGIEIKETVHYVYSSSFVTDRGQHVVNVVFLCEDGAGTACCKSPDEVEAVYWMTYDEVMNDPRTPAWTKESVARAAKVLASVRSAQEPKSDISPI
ncbi:DNA mismatch repair protein MutT [Gordoniibacillus kamchatkensis]|uniref:DNA mismatch repair protein MutT n=1 Tax=Gordoniibacillus kamchatkensis TaxID=1590651 RepID=A0ABR5AEX7_9BACL|nr:NUDIX domain-containing protein [Paenibacillus sp. VKM B-2647]KIL38952.1 DNA mismatch repair protein MutT [Paenibacillus sp. VKM B-2647]